MNSITKRTHKPVLFLKYFLFAVVGMITLNFSFQSMAQFIPNQNFNHDSTSFQLLGAHRNLDCKQCHSGGRYKGTPRMCEDCHNGQLTYGKPINHLATNQTCTLCHSQNAWVPSNFTHDPSTTGQCSNCHNGQKATGKPANHISTNSQCDTCHRTTAWSPAGFNHSNIAGQLCSTCHRSGGPGMAPKIDIVHSNLSGQDCGSCHGSTTTFSTVTMNHTGISPPASCATCHIAGNSVGAVSTPNPHPYAAANSDCSQCHRSFTSFSGASFDHTGVTSCKSCHFSGNAMGAMPPPTTGGDLIHNPLSSIITDCSTCHTSTQTGGFSAYTHTWSTFHTAFIPTPCMNCHKSGNVMGAKTKPSGHPTTALDCASAGCHTTSTFSK